MKFIPNVALSGIGGYGALYVSSLLQLESLGHARLCAVIDPLSKNSKDWPMLAARQVPQFGSMSDFLNSGIRADLAVISSPIAFHAEQSCAALRAGADVLCEKPLCVTVEEAHAMIAARNASGRRLSVGYQCSFSEPTQRLKADFLAGRFGAPLDFSTLYSFPRGKTYYTRNDWAGCARDPQGRLVLDSPVNNAGAHHLHRMLYLLGTQIDRSATPLSITAECYRANPISNFDAACLRVETQENVPVLYFAAHSGHETLDVKIRLRCENAVIRYKKECGLTVRFSNGTEEIYGDPYADQMRKLHDCVKWLREDSNAITPCGPEAAMMHTVCVNGLSSIPVQSFDPALLQKLTWNETDELTAMPELNKAMTQGFERSALFSEMGLSWATPAQRVDLTPYF